MQQIKSFQLSVRVFKMHAKYMQMFVNIRAMSICLYSLPFQFNRTKRELLGSIFRQKGERYIKDKFDHQVCWPKAFLKVSTELFN